MKEHRVRTLRVTTPGNIASREREDAGHGDESLRSVQLLRLQPQLGPASPEFAHLLGVADVKTPSAADPHRRPACSICGPSHGTHNKRRSPQLQRREREAGAARAPSPSAGCPSCGPCAQPLLHLLSGDLDRCWESVLLALRLLAAPAAIDEATAVAVNGVVAHRVLGRVRVQVRACGREAEGWRPCWVAGRDAEGHTPLLLAGRRLLAAGRWADAAQVCALLLAAGSDANAVNWDGRSLLSYAVAALDEAADTTRLLLNYGANVWGAGLSDAVPLPTLRPPRPPSEPDPSSSSPVFAWFLRAVIRRRRLDAGCLQTLALVSAVMAERPRLMHSIVLRTMLRQSRCFRVLGPVFLQIKTAMARHWSTPQDLRTLCRRAIRRAVGKAPLQEGVSTLGLPVTVQQYLLLYS